MLSEDEKTAFHTMLHSTRLFAKVNGIEQTYAFLMVNETLKDIRKADPSDSLVSSINKTVDSVVSQCNKRLEDIDYNLPSANLTKLRWIV